MIQLIITAMASINNCPPSPLDSMPITVKCERTAPAIKPVPSKAPIKTVGGNKSIRDVKSSIIPVPILPQGSAPNFVKSSTDSGCPENLKYKVYHISICALFSTFAIFFATSIYSYHFEEFCPPNGNIRAQ